MSLFCPRNACKPEPGMCAHDKIMAVVALTLIALFIRRLTF
jgi:hypothetical protein